MTHWLQPIDVCDRAPLWQLAKAGLCDPTLAERISKAAYAAILPLYAPRALYVKGILLLKGWGGAPCRPLLGVRHLWHASIRHVAQASYDLSSLYFCGINGYRWPKVGFRLMVWAARDGMLEAVERLGRLCCEGTGTAQDPILAKQLFRHAARRGNIRARHNLAVMYRDEGRFRFAVHELSIAAAAGFADSQYALALHLLEGRGIRANAALAHHYFKLAARNGNRDALDFLQEKKD